MSRARAPGCSPASRSPTGSTSSPAPHPAAGSSSCNTGGTASPAARSLARWVEQRPDVPRNVVTLTPRRLVLPIRRNRTARERIERALVEKYRARREADPERIAIDFSKRALRRAAKDEVAAELDRIEPRWRRLYVLYPSEPSLRQRGE